MEEREIPLGGTQKGRRGANGKPQKEKPENGNEGQRTSIIGRVAEKGKLKDNLQRVEKRTKIRRGKRGVFSIKRRPTFTRRVQKH